MFRRTGAVTRSLHAPHGINIHALDKNPRMKRKLSWSSPKVRNAASEGVLTHKPVVLKEGFLYKPGFLRIGARKRRWCVLRTYSQSEASIDIYMDDTKSRFKGTISLDKDLCPMLIVKNYDSKKKTPKNVYLMLKIGKRTYQFTADSFRELKEWSALMRQAIDNGLLFSGKITEPLNIEDGMVNVKFNTNCIAVICPIKENAMKTWRLNHITSFGQCGGMLTFECCSTCSDPGTSRCTINLVQEKPTIILNLMEKAIRSNPNTSQIHYERSILGDIYHCVHECGQPQRLIPAYSDPNLFRSTSTSPQKEVTVPIDIHEMFEVNNNSSTLSSGKSSDSGFPETPFTQQDAVSINSNTPSPTDVGNKTPTKQHSARINILPLPPVPTAVHGRSMSELARPPDELYTSNIRRKSESSEFCSINRLSKTNYTDVKTTSSPRRSRIEDQVQYSTIQLASHGDSPSRDRRSGPRLQPVDENDGIYDIPNCEPSYCEVGDVFSPPITPINGYRRNSGQNEVPRKQSISSTYLPGTDLRDREDDYEELPPVPKHRRARPPAKEMVQIFSNVGHRTGRLRLHSTGDVLDCGPDLRKSPMSRFRGSVDNLSEAGRKNGLNSHNDQLLIGLQKENENLSRVLARSRNERNDELSDIKEDELPKCYRCFNPDDLDCELDSDNHLYASPTNMRSGRSSAASDKSVERVLTKVASDTVRGYAYKIQIPLSNSEYDVPRRAAPAPDLSNIRSDAPPKPRRYNTSVEP